MTWRENPVTFDEARELAELSEGTSNSSLCGKRDAAIFMLMAEGLTANEIVGLPYNYNTSRFSGETRERIQDWRECFPEPWTLLFCRVTSQNSIAYKTLSAFAVRDRLSKWRNPARRPQAKENSSSRYNDDGEAVESATANDGMCACLWTFSDRCSGRMIGEKLVECRLEERIYAEHRKFHELPPRRRGSDGKVKITKLSRRE